MAGRFHLVRRFLGSLSSAPPAPDDEQWAQVRLLPGELALWLRMNNHDRRHAIAVARRTSRSLGLDADRSVVAAALLHDVGKIDSGLGTPARVLATVWSAVLGRPRAAAGHGRLARYLRHDAIGARLLIDAGSDELTAAWANEHHRPEQSWTVAMPIARALKSADDD